MQSPLLVRASGFQAGNRHCGSRFPNYIRRFNQAFLGLPALPSEVVEGAADHPEVVVRRIRTPKDGTYFLVVNTSMQPVETRVGVPGTTRDLVERKDLGELGELKLKLHSGELRTYRAVPD